MKSKPPELGPSAPGWTRCDNRRSFLYNRIVHRNIGIRAYARFSNLVTELSAGKENLARKVVAIREPSLFYFTDLLALRV